MLQFGPSDYSVGSGKPGGGHLPEVQEAQKRMSAMALEAGRHPRVEIGTLEQAKPWMDLGVRHFCVGWDISVVFGWCKQQGQLVEQLGLKGATKGPEVQYPAARA